MDKPEGLSPYWRQCDVRPNPDIGSRNGGGQHRGVDSDCQARPDFTRRRSRDRGGDREGHVRVRDLSERSAENRRAHHQPGQQALLQRPARAPGGAGLRHSDGRPGHARHDQAGDVGQGQQRQAGRHRRDFENAEACSRCGRDGAFGRCREGRRAVLRDAG